MGQAISHHIVQEESHYLRDFDVQYHSVMKVKLVNPLLQFLDSGNVGEIFHSLPSESSPSHAIINTCIARLGSQYGEISI